MAKVVRCFVFYLIILSFKFLDPEEIVDLVFLMRPSSMMKVTGQSAVLPCVVSGLPAPVVRWMKNEEVLDTER
jgi:neogenin